MVVNIPIPYITTSMKTILMIFNQQNYDTSQNWNISQRYNKPPTKIVEAV